MKKIILILSLLVLSGCNDLDNGVVVKKYYEAERIYTTYVRSGKVNVPIINTDDEDYMVVIRGKVNDKPREEHLKVTEKEYNEIQNGWIYVCEGGTCGGCNKVCQIVRPEGLQPEKPTPQPSKKVEVKEIKKDTDYGW